MPPTRDIFAARWPALSRAIVRQNHQQAMKDFSRLAERAVISGIIRFDDRRRLARIARHAAIRPFDAQLLIACAIRRWHLHHPQTSTPPTQPAASQDKESRIPVLALSAAAALAALETLLVWSCLRA